MKSAGFNAVRCAHNPPAPAFLDACDRLGLLVIDESFDCWRTGKNPGDYHLFFEDWWQRDTESMVKRDRNHPSIVIWSIGNEIPERTGVSGGVEWARKQAAYVRSLDPTRPVSSSLDFLYEDLLAEPGLMDSMTQITGAQNFSDLKKHVPTDPEKDTFGNRTRAFSEALDLAGYNYLYQRYEWDHSRFPERVIAGTESYPLQAFDFWKQTERLPYVIGDFVWTAIDYIGESGLGQVTVDDPRPPHAALAAYPYHLANCGDFDICGFKRPQSYYRDLLWKVRKEPFIAVLDPQLYGRQLGLSEWSYDPVIDSWTFPGQEGKPARVDVYSIDDEVELRLNGVLVGRQPAGERQKNKATFTIAYQPGTIEAVGYKNGKAVSRACLITAGAPAALKCSVDRVQIHQAYGDLAYVTVEVVDERGCLVPYADHEITVEVYGNGNLAAVGTGNPLSEELYTGPSRKAWQGRLMAVVCSTGQAGEILIRATAGQLGSAEVTLAAG
jgi:beta-galactosidase